MSTNSSTEILVTYDSATTTLSIDLSGLAPATYGGSVTYTDTSGQNTTATVSLTISQVAPPPPPPPPPTVGNPYGGGWIGGMPSTENLWPVLVRSGARHFRYQIQWDKIEPTKDSYLWRQVDDFVTLTKAKTLLPTFVIQNPPSWRTVPLACNAGHFVPDPTQIGAFAALLCQRYPGAFYSIEVNNEGFNAGNLCADMFTKQLLPSLQAVKQGITQHSPGTLVGGPAQLANGSANATQWWQLFYQAGCHTYCDYLNFHYYPGGSPDSADPGHCTFLDRVKIITDAQTQSHDTGRPVWLTEVGWKRLNSAGTNGGVPDGTLATYITKLLKEAEASGMVKKVIYFNLADLAPGSGANQNFGLQCYGAWAGYIAAHPQW